MVQINPSDLPALPVEQLAQFLLGCAREDPTLLARSNSGPVVRREANLRMPSGSPIDLSGMEDGSSVVRPVDASPKAKVRAEVPMARPDFLTRRPEVLSPEPDATSRKYARQPPVVPSFRPIGPSPAPGVPSFSPIVPSPLPTNALSELASGFPRQIQALSGPIETAPTPLGNAAGPTAVPIETPAYLFEILEQRSAKPVTPSPVESAVSPADATAGSSVTPDDVLSVTSAIGPIDETAAPFPVEGLPGPVDATARMVVQKLQLRRTDARDDPELEELVSIAVACARRAEDAVQQAREIHWMARRRMSIVAAVTGAGVLAASAVGIIDRYQTTGEQRGAASAFLSGPMIADVTGIPGSPGGSAARPDIAQASSSAAEAIGAPTPPADRVRGSDTPRAVAEGASASPSSAPAPIALAAAAPAKPAPAPIAAVPLAAAPTVPASSRTVPVAAAAVSPTRPSAVADGRMTSPPAATQQFAAAVPPPARAVDPAKPAAVETPMRSPEVPPSTDNIAAAEPLQYGEASAPPDVLPGPQISHPARHARRVARRPVYYVQGPGVLLAQVVYGVRRNLYEIFH